MKKISFYILISFLIFNFFLPFGIVLNEKLVQKNIALAANDCTITSAVWNPEGEQADNFYVEKETTATIIVKTKNCVGVPNVNLNIWESDGLTDGTDDLWNDSGFYNREIAVPTDNFTISLLLGEEDCENFAAGGIGFDCDLYFKLGKEGGNIYDSFDEPGDKGMLYYDCDDLCFENGQLLEIIPNGNNDTPVNVDSMNPKNLDNSYNLLAPIGTFTQAPENIGDYFNTIFLIAIGLCGALAVVMIVIGGIQYMGEESIFGKTKAKEQITSAILGLLIALGAFALLNTINPDLLGGGGVHIAQVSAEIVPLYDRGSGDEKKANGESVRCTPVTAGPCTVENLTPIFGAENAVAMSKICNMESGGTNATSGTDVCKPGNNPFSFGLFQVNLAANGTLAGTDCVGLFDKAVAGRDAIEPKYTSGFSCKLMPGKETLYNTCKNILLDPTKNLEIAKSLFTPDKKAWIGDKKYCASAFN